MSNEENAKETVSEIVDDAKEKVSEIVDDTKETANEAAESASNAVSNIVSKLMELKESNPKVFFGAIGGLVVVILLMMMMGGGSKKNLPVTSSVNVSVGQNYTLKGVNSYDPAATIRLVSIPGSMAAYDDTEKGDREGACKHMPQGTKVKVVQVQQAFGKAQFVEVEMLEGECAGQKGWAISNNLN